MSHIDTIKHKLGAVKISSVQISEVLYIGLLTFILMSFLGLPLPAFLVVFPLQITFNYHFKSKLSIFINSMGYFFALCILGIYVSMLYRFIFLAIVSSGIILYIRYLSKGKSTEKYIQAAFTAMMPFCIVFIIEFMQRNTNNAFQIMFTSYKRPDETFWFHISYCLTVLFIWGLYFLLTLFFKKKLTAALLTALPLFLLGCINMVVLYLTSSPFLPSDVYIFQTAMDVIGEQKITLDLILLMLTSLLLVGVFIYSSKKIYKDTVTNKIRRMVQGLIASICVLLLYISIGSIDMLNFHANYRNGFLYFFIQQAQSELDKPAGYIPLHIDTSLSEDAVTAKENPNVIIIMSEAFSDLADTYGTQMSEDPIPYFHSLQESYPNGIVYSSVFGNNTVSSEFEALTGISTGFSTKGSNIYQRYLKGKDEFYTIGSYYSDLGYKTGIFHPAAGNNYNRYTVYDIMNYDERIFLGNLSQDTDKIRDFVTDKENFEKVTELIHETQEPLFLMNITMQNHGSYENPIEISPYITLENADEEYKDTELYLSLLKKSDDALKDFLSDLSSSSEPTVVLFFGDHQPMINNDFYSEQIGTEYTELNLEEKARTYEVPYLLWSNYKTGVSFDAPEKTSMNYLSLILNSYIGNPDTEWLSLLRELQQYYPVITENFVIDADGTLISIDEVKSLLSVSEDVNLPTTLLKKYQFGCYSFIQ